MTTTIYLVRLGQTKANEMEILSNFSRLTSAGRSQAESLRDRLNGESFDAFISSCLMPAIETSEIIMKPHEKCISLNYDEFNELDWGEWEGLTKSEIAKTWPQEWINFISGNSIKTPSGESLEDVSSRMTLGIIKVSEKFAGGKVCVVSHGASSRILIANLLKAPVSSFSRLPNINTGLTIFDFEPKKGAVFSLIADGCHLDSNEQGLVVKYSLK